MNSLQDEHSWEQFYVTAHKESNSPEKAAFSPTFMSLMSRYSSIIACAFFFIASSDSSGVGETEAEAASTGEAATGISLGDSLPPSRSWLLR